MFVVYCSFRFFSYYRYSLFFRSSLFDFLLILWFDRLGVDDGYVTISQLYPTPSGITVCNSSILSWRKGVDQLDLYDYDYQYIFEYFFQSVKLGMNPNMIRNRQTYQV